MTHNLACIATLTNRRNGEFESSNDLRVCFLPVRAFISALANGNTIRVFKVQKKHDGTGNTVTGEFDFPQEHKADIINVGVSASGKFIMSCSNDTTIVIWNLKGRKWTFCTTTTPF